MQYDSWARARRAETSYAARLRKIARHILDIIRGFSPDDWVGMRMALEKYAETITPWAESVVNTVLEEMKARDRKQWREASKEMGRQLHFEIDNTPIGEITRQSVQRQVGLITSLPREAAARAQSIAMQAMQGGLRAADVSKEIQKLGDITKARANVIARTEVGRATAELTSARAQYVGSEYFVWRTMKDGHVRPSHKALEGKSFRWEDPPVCDPGIRALPGASPNCRCFAEPIIPGVTRRAI